MEEFNKITSRENARLQHFRKVRGGKVRDQIFLEGVRLAEEALKSGTRIVDALISSEFHANPRRAPILAGLQEQGIEVNEAVPRLFNGVADTVNSQGMILIAGRPTTERFVIEERPGPSTLMFVYLHEISDPSNLGAVFRTAEAAGVSGILLSSASADPFSPKALRAGLGANLRVPAWENAGLGDAQSWMKELKGQTVAADIKGKLDHSEYSWIGPKMIVMGSEAHGLTADALKIADEVVRIPMKRGVESLNLAVAAGVILFEAARQRSLAR